MSLEILYSRYFDKTFSCSTLTEIVKVGGTFSSSTPCISSCQIENNGGNLYSLSLQYNDYPSGFEIEKIINQPHQIVGVELVYYTSEKFYMSIYDGTTLIETVIINKSIAVNNLQQLNYNFECGFNPLSTLYQTYKYSKTLSSNKLRVRFTGSPSLPSTYGLVKVKMWANCLENCLVCSNATNCSTCQQGFQLVKLVSGQNVCAEITTCKQTNCFLCARSITPDFQICLQCMPGYTLNQSTSTCVANTGSSVCKTTQYLDVDNTCKFYSKVCQMQDPTDNTKWISCGQIPDDTQIKCQKEQNILLYDIQNYQVKNCGCTIAFCSKCVTATFCKQCVTGYSTSDNLTCSFTGCPVGQVKNSTTQLCEATASCTTNCQTCTATECTQCIVGNYYIDQSNKLNCQACTIPNCVSCDNSGYCSACLSGYVTNFARTQCELCSVSNCTLCVSNNNLQCDTCVTNFLKNGSNQCICQAANCQQCSSTDGNKCSACITGYVKINDICSCKVSNCQTCDPTDGSICLLCSNPNEEFDPVLKICTCKVKNCISCLNSECDGLCSNQMYYNMQLKECQCKIKACLTCLNGKCSLCAAGYQYDPVTNQCPCTIPNCMQCDPSNGAICDKCNLNFFPNQTEKCGASVKNCLVYDLNDGSKCKTCQTNYKLENDGSCSVQVPKCVLGVDNEGLKCQQCIKGYAPDNSQTSCVCTLNNCAQCDPNDGTICIQCKTNYNLVNANQECQCKVNNCQTCNSNDGQFCDVCLSQYNLTTDKRQCLIDCQITNCLQCDIQPNSTIFCKKCAKKFVFDTITNTCIPCLASNCDYCLENNPQQCQICSQNYEITFTSNNQCVLQQCRVFGCTQCNTSNLNRCDACGQEYFLDATSGICQMLYQNTFEVSQKQTYTGYNITLIFKREVTFQNLSLESILKANIVNFNSYEKVFTKISEKVLVISLTLKEDCKGQSLLIQMDENFVKVNNLSKQKEEINLMNFAVVNEQQIAQAQTTKDVTENVKTTLISTMLPIAMLGNFYVLFNTIDLTTFIYYLLYVKVRYPINITNFCGVFQNFQMAFIPNIFQVYLLDGYVQFSTPSKFLENGADAYFLNGGGQSLTIISGILMIYLFLKIVSKMSFYKPLQVYVQSKIESGWEYCGFFDLIWTVYMYVLVSCFLQLFEFSFDNNFCFLNYSLWALFTLSVFFIPIWITIFIAKSDNLTDPQIQKQYGSIIGGLRIPEQELQNLQDSPQVLENGEEKQILKEEHYGSRRNSLINLSPTHQQQQSQFSHQIIGQESPSLLSQKSKYKPLTTQQKLQGQWSRYTNIFLYFRKILYAIFLIFLADFPYLQLFTISLLNFFLAVHYFYIRPHENKIENIRNGISETVLIVMQCTICILVNDSTDEVEQDRINVGWMLIACAAMILLLHIIFVVLDLLKGIFNLIKDFINILIKFKKGLFVNQQNQQEEEKIRLENLEKLGTVIPNVIGTNNFRRSDTKKLTGLFVANLNNSMMTSPRKSNRRNTYLNEHSFAVSGAATTKILDALNINPSSSNKILRNQDINSGDISMMSNVSKVHFQMDQKQLSKQIFNQDQDASMCKSAYRNGNNN